MQPFKLIILSPSLQIKKTPSVAYVVNKQTKSKSLMIDENALLKTSTSQKRGFQSAVHNSISNAAPIDFDRPTNTTLGGQNSLQQ